MDLKSILEIKNLHVEVDEKPIIRGLDLTINPGEIHAIMGPNGSGKSTLASVLMGHPRYQVIDGTMTFKGQNILAMNPAQRAQAGLFLAFQYPKEISGVNMIEFLRMAYKAQHPGKKLSVFEFKKMLDDEMAELEIDEKFANRFINHGFSGGEKKKAEMLQMAILKPQLSILDETDSGLDVDALKIVCQTINRLAKHKAENMEARSILMITHYQRILNYITPDFVHIMVEGKIIKSGKADFAKEIEEKGYKELLNK